MTWEKFFGNCIRIVFLSAYGAFLWASIHHIAWFYHSFESDTTDWSGSYWLAASIDVTQLVLTIGIMFFRKKMPRFAFGLVCFFIVFLTAFSWLVNWEFAAYFQSPSLTHNPILAMLNPILASSFAFLNLAYSIVAEAFNTQPKSIKELQAELDGLDARLQLENQIKRAKNTGKKGLIERAKDTAIEIKNAANEVLEKPGSIEIKESKPEMIKPAVNQPIEHVSPSVVEKENYQEEMVIEEEQKQQSEQATSRRTMTIEEVISVTGLTERRIKNLIAKRVLKVSSRNPQLVLISSVDGWLRIAPNDKETKELPVVQLASNNHRNGERNGTS